MSPFYIDCHWLHHCQLRVISCRCQGKNGIFQVIDDDQGLLCVYGVPDGDIVMADDDAWLGHWTVEQLVLNLKPVVAFLFLVPVWKIPAIFAPLATSRSSGRQVIQNNGQSGDFEDRRHLKGHKSILTRTIVWSPANAACRWKPRRLRRHIETFHHCYKLLDADGKSPALALPWGTTTCR